jgi:hypothetical protein
MSHRKPPPASARRGPQPSTLAAAAAVLVLLPLTAYLGRQWLELSRRSAALEGELATLTSRGVVLKLAGDALSPQKFQVCNKSKDALSVPWLAAVYHDGTRLRLFDPLRCGGWRPQEIAGGESRVLHFSSTEDESCNWNGSTVFYAMRLVRQAEDAPVAYNVAGPWRGFDRDCFTVE